MSLCYEVMIHVAGNPDYMDRSISANTCLTKEQAIEIVNECNKRTRDIPVKYYWRIKNECLSR